MLTLWDGGKNNGTEKSAGSTSDNPLPEVLKYARRQHLYSG
jgi:hypothetical protein